METLREFPILNEVRELNIFADNAYTSADTLRKHYLNKIDRQSSAKRARKIAVADPYANMPMQERSNKVIEDIKAKRTKKDKKFLKWIKQKEDNQTNKVESLVFNYTQSNGCSDETQPFCLRSF